MTVPGASGNIPERDWGLSGFDGDQEVPAAGFAAGLTRLPYLSAALRRQPAVDHHRRDRPLLGAAFSVLKPALLPGLDLGAADPSAGRRPGRGHADRRGAGRQPGRGHAWCPPARLADNVTCSLQLHGRVADRPDPADHREGATSRRRCAARSRWRSSSWPSAPASCGPSRSRSPRTCGRRSPRPAARRPAAGADHQAAGDRRGHHRPDRQAQSGVQYADRSREGGHRLQRQRAAGHLGDHRGQQGPRFRLAHPALPVQGTGAVRGGWHDRRPAGRPGHRGDHGPGGGPAAPQGRRGPGARRAGGAERRPAPGGRLAAPQGPGRGSGPGLPAGGELPPGRSRDGPARTMRRWP